MGLKTTYEDLIAARQVSVTWKRWQEATYDPDWDEYSDTVFDEVQVPARILGQQEEEDIRKEGTERKKTLRILLLAKDLDREVTPRDRFVVLGAEYRVAEIKQRVLESEVVGYEIALEG